MIGQPLWQKRQNDFFNERLPCPQIELGGPVCAGHDRDPTIQCVHELGFHGGFRWWVILKHKKRGCELVSKTCSQWCPAPPHPLVLSLEISFNYAPHPAT